MKKTLKKLEFSLRMAVKSSPALYSLSRRLKYSHRDDKICRPSDRLCVEGYPSSANSFTYVLLQQLSGELPMAHHTHSLANIKLALKYKIPVLVLIRSPLGAIVSRVVRFDNPIDDSIKEYQHFYTYVASRLDELVLFRFEDITTQTAECVKYLEKRTGLEFPFADMQAEKQKAFRYIEEWTKEHGRQARISLPTAEREKNKEKIKNKISQSQGLQEIQQLYARIIEQIGTCFPS